MTAPPTEGPDMSTHQPHRLQLSDNSWVEHHRAWVPSPDQALRRVTGELAWEQVRLNMYGKVVAQPRLTAVCGKSMSPASRYRRPNPDTPWTATTERIRQLVASALPDWEPNGLLANWYRDGSDSISWHADDEPALGHRPTVVSISLGATRTFVLRPRATGPRTPIELGHGDLLIMGGHTQREYLHSIAKVGRPTDSRVSLTFRHYLP